MLPRWLFSRGILEPHTYFPPPESAAAAASTATTGNGRGVAAGVGKLEQSLDATESVDRWRRRRFGACFKCINILTTIL